MKVTIIPHNTSRIKIVSINKFLIGGFILIILIPLLSRYLRSKEFIKSSTSKLEVANQQLEKDLGHFQQEYEALDNKYKTLLIQAKKLQSSTFLKPQDKELPVTESIDGLLGDMQESKQVLQNIQLEIKHNKELVKFTPSIFPVNGYVTQPFGPTQDIFTGEQRFCQGIDITAPKGSKVYATADGVVKFAGYHRHSGLEVIINHKNRFETRYSHLAFIKTRKYQIVKRGDVIGFVGTTGKTIGPRLHYEIWINGEPKNPLDFILTKVNFF
ncbi:M23 family metallopeptidase [candidate division WOR-3 bacterium]|nr:M23 family metallopeptidase [candidate division WOR-3 bacterium]